MVRNDQEYRIGDEVICPAFTFMATYEAVLEVGAELEDAASRGDRAAVEALVPRLKAALPPARGDG